MLRANSRLRTEIGPHGVEFLEQAVGAINRILPHVEMSSWVEQAKWKKPDAVWTTRKRTELRVTVSVGTKDRGRSMTVNVQRRGVPTQPGAGRRVLDMREQDICRRIARRTSDVLGFAPQATNGASLLAIAASFDEQVIAEHLREHHEFSLALTEIFGALHTLAEQTYENKSLRFGCVIDPRSRNLAATVFPRDFLQTKKYKALSDGYRTAYHLSSSGQILGFVDLDSFESRLLTKKHFYPRWAEPMARASRDRKCGIALSRQGDLLVFDEGSLRFTYRNGRWQYWNHAHLITLWRDRARAQHVLPTALGRIVGDIYRVALDISFRRTGALFVVLRNQQNLRKIVRLGDAIGDPGRAPADVEFDQAAGAILRRSVMVELASLDGAVVPNNSGHIKAYGAVLRPHRTGRLRGSEGSRTKAAIGASLYGLSVKVSSDGDITVYHGGKKFISI